MKRKITEETRKKMSEKRKEYYQNLDNIPSPANKKEHILINNVSHKECSQCKKILTLDSFGKYKKCWDGLNRICKDCNYENCKQSRDKKKLSPDQLKQSYATRKTVSIPIIAKNETESLEFSSMSEAHRQGYNRAAIRKAIQTNQKYKDHTWSYKE